MLTVLPLLKEHRWADEQNLLSHTGIILNDEAPTFDCNLKTNLKYKTKHFFNCRGNIRELGATWRHCKAKQYFGYMLTTAKQIVRSQEEVILHCKPSTYCTSPHVNMTRIIWVTNSLPQKQKWTCSYIHVISVLNKLPHLSQNVPWIFFL